MKFPKKMYPYLHELEEMEFSDPKRDSWVFRSAFKELLHKEYNHRSNLIHYRVVELGGNNGVHKFKIDEKAES
jgi:predicted transcriptional regulator with HTH domain